MNIRERAEKSNEEPVIFNKESIVIDQHLAENKILVAVKRNPEGKELGFFKKVGDTLQVHICIPDKDGKNEWHRFYVLNADEEEKKRNIRLNILR
jgi:hypothetical protein